jgi:hypothetical protein
LFSESVTGFIASEISLTGTAATVTDLRGTGAVYTAEITPTDSGDVTIQVPADVAEDEAGNFNTASANQTVSVDLARPSVDAEITPEVGADGNVIIQVPENVAQDDATNGNTPSNTHTVPVDLVPPTVTITSVPTTPQNERPDNPTDWRIHSVHNFQ